MSPIEGWETLVYMNTLRQNMRNFHDDNPVKFYKRNCKRKLILHVSCMSSLYTNVAPIVRLKGQKKAFDDLHWNLCNRAQFVSLKYIMAMVIFKQ